MAEDSLRQAVAVSRVFLAMPLYGIFEREIDRILRPLQREFSSVKWAVPRQVHLTLHFFGSVPTKEIELIRLSSKKVASLFSPFELSLDRIGGFPNLERPDIVWLGVKDSSGRLLSLQRAIQGEVRALGFQPETRPFAPHATIGRVKRKSLGLGPFLAKASFEIPTPLKSADHFVLYQSHFLPEGVHYEILETYPLSKKS